jgi:hypothetical protein
VRNLAAVLRLGFVLCLLSAPALADTVKFTAELSPVKPEDTGKGTATLSLDTGTKTLNWSIEYSGLAKPPALAGFLAPGLKPTDDADMVPMEIPANAASPIAGSMKLTDDQMTGIENGNWVLMLGTEEAPEIGGDVKRAG